MSNDTSQSTPADVEALKKLTTEINNNPSIVYELPTERIDDYRRKMNPYGIQFTAEESFANISIINWRDRYHKKFLMTSLIGYLYRLVYEYEPELRLPAETTAEEKQKIINGIRMTINRFLNYHFEFDPDRHVRVAHNDEIKDPTYTMDRAELIKSRIENKARAKIVEDVIKGDANKGDADNGGETADTSCAGNSKYFDYLRNTTKGVYSAAKSALDDVNLFISALPEGFDEDILAVFEKRRNELRDNVAKISTFALPLARADTLEAVEHTPSAELFHNFDRYITNNYEQLLETTHALYIERPDIEFGILYYKWFKTQAEADDHYKCYEKEFRASVYTISNRQWTLLGPYRENRNRLNFYNKNTEVLKQMQEQVEADHKLASDMVDKTIRRKKAKNVAEVGPDAPGMSQYQKDFNPAKEAGIKSYVSTKDQKEMVDLHEKRKKIIEASPDESIPVEVYYPDEEGKIKHGFFYTQAEAPLHLANKDSPFAKKYQDRNVEITGQDENEPSGNSVGMLLHAVKNSDNMLQEYVESAPGDVPDMQTSSVVEATRDINDASQDNIM
ncbi:putative B602L protein [Faustovirus]|nr:putative B602L protein [Faustovirus]